MSTGHAFPLILDFSSCMPEDELTVSINVESAFIKIIHEKLTIRGGDAETHLSFFLYLPSSAPV
jgi:hypothetical protein